MNLTEDVRLYKGTHTAFVESADLVDELKPLEVVGCSPKEQVCQVGAPVELLPELEKMVDDIESPIIGREERN